MKKVSKTRAVLAIAAADKDGESMTDDEWARTKIKTPQKVV